VLREYMTTARWGWMCTGRARIAGAVCGGLNERSPPAGRLAAETPRKLEGCAMTVGRTADRCVSDAVPCSGDGLRDQGGAHLSCADDPPLGGVNERVGAVTS